MVEVLSVRERTINEGIPEEESILSRYTIDEIKAYLSLNGYSITQSMDANHYLGNNTGLVHYLTIFPMQDAADLSKLVDDVLASIGKKMPSTETTSRFLEVDLIGIDKYAADKKIGEIPVEIFPRIYFLSDVGRLFTIYHGKAPDGEEKTDARSFPHATAACVIYLFPSHDAYSRALSRAPVPGHPVNFVRKE